MATYYVDFGSEYMSYQDFSGTTKFAVSCDVISASSVPSWVTNVAVGDTLNLTNITADSWADGSSYTYPIRATNNYYADDEYEETLCDILIESTDTITLSGYYEGDGIEIDGFTVTNVTMSSRWGYPFYTITVSAPSGPEPPVYAESFSLDGYSDGDTIRIMNTGEQLSDATKIDIGYTPEGSESYSGAPMPSDYNSSILNPIVGTDMMTGQLQLCLMTYGVGTTSLTLSMPTASGTDYSETYTVVIEPLKSTSYALEGYSPNDTIAFRLGGSPKNINVAFSPVDSVPVAFTATSSNTSVATVAYANGAITITGVAEGSSTLTTTMTLFDGTTVVYTYTIDIQPAMSGTVLGGNAIAFLKGKIEAAGGSGVTELTAADYNTEVSGQACIGTWLLDTGIYRIKDEAIKVALYKYEYPVSRDGYIFVNEATNPDNSGVYYKYVYLLGTDAADILRNIYRIYTQDPPEPEDWASSQQQAPATYLTGDDVENILNARIAQNFIYDDPTKTPLTENYWGQIGELLSWTHVDSTVEPNTYDSSLWYMTTITYDSGTGAETYGWVKLTP